MNNLLNTISESVLGKSFESVEIKDLEQLAVDHPYASSIQLLYAEKLRAGNTDSFYQQWQKTLLYFNDPLLMHHLFQNEQEKAGAVEITTTGPFIPTEKALSESIADSEDHKLSQVPHTPDEPLGTDDHIPEENNQDNDSTSNDEEALPPVPPLTIEPIDPAKAGLSLTPYHTVDYFAAQGIKLTEQQNTNDRFGTQLKSFTEWLKQMKRLPGGATQAGISKTEEQNIDKLAEQSLTGENADTEAMAEVWAKQGNPKKAIETYQKLSLQNPAKSAYFAAKIDHLKQFI